MQLQRLQLKNVRGFRGDIDLDLRADDGVPQWVVFAGRNGSGKTTLLRSIALALAGPYAALQLTDSFSHWISIGADQAVAAAQLHFDPNLDRMVEGGRVPQFDPWVGLRWNRLSGPEPELEQYTRGKKWTPRRGPWAENPRGWFVAGYGPFRRLSSASGDVIKLMALPGRNSALVSLFREDATLSESVEWLRQLDYRTREGRLTDGHLLELTLGLLSSGLLPEAVEIDRVDSEGLWLNASGVTLPVNELSDGYRTVAAFAVDLVRSLAVSYDGVTSEETEEGVVITNPGVVLIDEIDAHLHPSWQQVIGPWLKTHFPKIQFLVTTHSPFVCQAADPGGLIRLGSLSEGVQVERVEGLLFHRIVNGTVDQTLLSELFGLDHTYSHESNAKRAALATLEHRAVRGRLTQEDAYRFNQLQLELLPSLDDEVLSPEA